MKHLLIFFLLLIPCSSIAGPPSAPQSAGAGDILADGSVPFAGDVNLDGFNLSNAGTMFLKEQADADADVEGSGQIWVNTATPNELYFTNDAGTDNEVILSAGTQTITGDKTFNGNIVIGNIILDNGTSPPATCTQGTLFHDTDAITGDQLLLCETTNNWVAQ